MSNRIRPGRPAFLLYGPDGRPLGPQPRRHSSGRGNVACCHGECWEDADERYKIVTPHPDKPGDTLTRIYCSPRHRDDDEELKGLGPIKLSI